MTADVGPILCPPLPRTERFDGGWRWRSPAKINLTLHVGALRGDGYHGLDSLVAKISLYDVLEFRPRDDGQIALHCDGFDCGNTQDNLVFRAAKLMQERSTAAPGCEIPSGATPAESAGVPARRTAANAAAVAPGTAAQSDVAAGLRSHGTQHQRERDARDTHGRDGQVTSRGVDIRLTKNIPPGSGLGGGSGDAATTLLALNELWSLLLPATELAEMAAALGSDVPLFLASPAVHMQGRGEIVRDVQLPPFWAVLYLSGRHCATGKVYKAFDEQLRRDVPAGPKRGQACPPYNSSPSGRGRPAGPGEGARVPASTVPDSTPATALTGQPSTWPTICVNDLQRPALEVCPPLEELMRELSRLTGEKVLMTGSGSGLFILADDEASAMALATKLPPEMQQHCRVVCRNTW